MPITSQPSEENHADSARVENRGPSMTTAVPRSWIAIPNSRARSIATDRTTGQYGSANEMCVVEERVEPRPAEHPDPGDRHVPPPSFLGVEVAVDGSFDLDLSDFAPSDDAVLEPPSASFFAAAERLSVA